MQNLLQLLCSLQLEFLFLLPHVLDPLTIFCCKIRSVNIQTSFEAKMNNDFSFLCLRTRFLKYFSLPS